MFANSLQNLAMSIKCKLKNRSELWKLCAIILSKVIFNFVVIGEIFRLSFENFENRKILITFERIMPQKGIRHIWKDGTLRISK